MIIAVEGVEGAGKSTLIRTLSRRLEDRAGPPVVLREPGGSALGEEIRNILLHSEYEIPAETEVFLFMASRAQLVREKIIPAVRAGRTVLLDRFLLSSVAYQGGAGGIGIENVIEMGRLAIKLRDSLPVLNLPSVIGKSNITYEVLPIRGYRNG